MAKVFGIISSLFLEYSQQVKSGGKRIPDLQSHKTNFAYSGPQTTFLLKPAFWFSICFIQKLKEGEQNEEKVETVVWSW